MTGAGRQRSGQQLEMGLSGDQVQLERTWFESQQHLRVGFRMGAKWLS